MILHSRTCSQGLRAQEKGGVTAARDAGGLKLMARPFLHWHVLEKLEHGVRHVLQRAEVHTLVVSELRERRVTDGGSSQVSSGWWRGGTFLLLMSPWSLMILRTCSGGISTLPESA